MLARHRAAVVQPLLGSSFLFARRSRAWTRPLLVALACLAATAAVAGAQTDPTPQALPYTQDFAGLTWTSTTYPAGWEGWKISNAVGSTFKTTAPTADRALTASGDASKNTAGVYNYNGALGFLGGSTAEYGLALGLTTTGVTGVSVRYVAGVVRNPWDGATNNRIDEMTLQYRVGTSGAFTTIDPLGFANDTTAQTSAVTTPLGPASRSIVLPAACDNQPVVELRWVARDSSGAGNRPSFSIDDVSIRSAFTLTTSAGANGSVSPSGSLTVAEGADVPVTLTPSAGYKVADVVVDGVSQGPSTSYTFIAVSANHTLAATFAEATPPTITVIAPNGGELWAPGSSHAIQWTASDNVAVASVSLEYSTTGGPPWTSIASGLTNTGTYSWLVPGATGPTTRVRATAIDAAANVGQDSSDGVFTIAGHAAGRILAFRADSANGTGANPWPSAVSPWTDLAPNHHDGALSNILGNGSSGWKGDGSAISPYRLEYDGEDLGHKDRVVVPAGSIAELQDSTQAVTAAVWFKTGWDAATPRYEYLLEWVQQPSPNGDPEFEGKGMSIIVQNGILQVYQNSWVDVATVAPDTWYHVVVAKAANDLRVYVNGQRAYTGTHPFMGAQQSPLTVGASAFRYFEGFSGNAAFGDFFSGSIAQVTVWPRALTDDEAHVEFVADSTEYLSAPADGPPTRVVRLTAPQADGANPYPTPGAGSPWHDLAGTPQDATLQNFAGDATSGWLGAGVLGDPWRLQFDGVDDVVTIPAQAVPELKTADAHSVELWFRTGPNSDAATYRYLLEWLQGFGTTPGMSIAVANGYLQVYLGNPSWFLAAPVAPSTWYHLAVVKQPGQCLVYLDGALVGIGTVVDFGDQMSEIVLGGSTWRGAGHYGDFFDGSLGEVDLWAGALSPSAIAADGAAGRDVYGHSLSVSVAGGSGTVAKSPDQATYYEGSSVQLTATADAGYVFAEWTGDVADVSNPLTIQMTSNRTLVANFITAAGVTDGAVPTQFALSRVAPSPARGAVRIDYDLPRTSPVKLSVIDVAGREVAVLANGVTPAGFHHATWSSTGARPPGVYFVRFAAGDRHFVKRVLVTR